MRLKTPTLDQLANIALIITCVLVGGSATYKLYRGVVPPSVQRPLKAGESVKNFADLDLAKAPRTLVMFTASTCHYCEASMPFYDQLTKVAGQAGTRLIGVTAEEPAKNRDYLASHDIRVEKVLPIGDNPMHLRGTPTLILLRSDGHVIKSWEGQLSGEVEKEVLTAISGAGL